MQTRGLRLVSGPVWTSLVTLLTIAGLGLSGSNAAADAEQPRFFDPALSYRIPLDAAPARGPADAPITIVEFSDFICPYCARAQNTLLDLERLYPGQIRLVYRHNPLDLEDAGLPAEASMAAWAQGQFWPMHDLIYGAGGRVNRSQVEGFALALGLDMARFRRDLDQHRQRARIEADAAVAHTLGILSTPTFFVNGRPVMGAMPLDVFVRIIDEELAKARSLVADGVAPDRLYEHLMTQARARGEDPNTLDRERARANLERYASTTLDPGYLYRVGPGLPGHSFGPADAPVIVTVFSDFECPYCARLFPVLEELRAAYPKRVRIVFRHLPLPFHPRAQLVAEAAVAAAMQNRLWAFKERVYAEPQALTRAAMERHARALGLNMDAFRAALDERRYLEQVTADMAAGKLLGVRGTPTLFVNGTPIPGGAPFEALDRHIFRPKLSEAAGLIDAGVAPADVYETLLRNAGNERVRGFANLAATDGIHGFVPAQIGSDNHRDKRADGGADASGGPHRADDAKRAALLRACRAGNHERARDLYGQLNQPEDHRDTVRAQCQPFGIDLPAQQTQ